MYKTIGIDVGTNNLAVSVFLNTDLRYYKILENKKSLSSGEKLLNIEKFLRELFKKEKPNMIVFEGTFWNPREARGYSYVSAAIGIIQMVAWEVLRIEPVKLQPSTVKKLITGNGRAKKEEVADKIKEQFNLTGDHPDHITDAIAIGFSYVLKQSEVM